MGWVFSNGRFGPVVRWEGDPPEYLYHWTSKENLRRILEDRVLRPGRGGGLQTGGEYPAISFTDTPRSPNYSIVPAELRLRTRDIPGVFPVTYVERRYEKGSIRGSFPYRPAPPEQLRSIGFADEHEWATLEPVPLRRGRFAHTPLRWVPTPEVA